MYHIMVESGLNRLKIALNEELWNIHTAMIVNAGTQGSISAQTYRLIEQQISRTMTPEIDATQALNKELLCISFFFLLYIRSIYFLSFL